MRLPAVSLACVAMMVTACHEQKVPEQDAAELSSSTVRPSPSVAAVPSTPSLNVLPSAPPSRPAPAKAVAPPPEVIIAEPESKGRREIANAGLLPLNRILAIARGRVPGEVIEVDLDDDDDDVAEYDIEILTGDGRSIDIKIDARSGKILKVEED